MTTSKDQGPNAPGADDLAARTTEQMLGPNPFTGLRKEDIIATVQESLSKRSGEMRSAPAALGSERYKPGTKAPGTYGTEP